MNIYQYCKIRIFFLGFRILIKIQKPNLFLVLNLVYKDEPRPEYAPKKKSVSKPKAARPPMVATIQRGILPISLILFNFRKNM